MPNQEVFLPKYQLDPLEMAVSVVNPNEATYRTVYFENIGPTPILFELDKDTSGLVIVVVILTATKVTNIAMLWEVFIKLLGSLRDENWRVVG